MSDKEGLLFCRLSVFLKQSKAAPSVSQYRPVHTRCSLDHAMEDGENEPIVPPLWSSLALYRNCRITPARSSNPNSRAGAQSSATAGTNMLPAGDRRKREVRDVEHVAAEDRTRTNSQAEKRTTAAGEHGTNSSQAQAQGPQTNIVLS